MNIFLKRFDIRSVSLYILERYWDDIVTVIYKPQFMNSPIYTCTRMEIFRFLLKKGVHVDDIVYPQKYDHRKSLYTYDIVLEYWYHHTNRKQNTKKQNLENLDKWNDIKFIINEFDNFREETYFACKGIQFIIPKWFLYFYVYFKPIKDYAGFDKSYVPFVSSSSVEAFFDLISDLDIKHTSSSGVNLFMMLLDSSIEDMIKGCELLLKFGLNPLKKDIEGRSFFDILLSKENKYSKVIELIKREVNLNSFSQTKIELDISAKTRVYPLPRTMDNTFSQDSTKLVEKKPNPISRRNQKENDLIQSIDLKKSTIQNIMQETIYKDNALLELIFSNVIKSK